MVKAKSIWEISQQGVSINALMNNQSAGYALTEPKPQAFTLLETISKKGKIQLAKVTQDGMLKGKIFNGVFMTYQEIQDFRKAQKLARQEARKLRALIKKSKIEADKLVKGSNLSETGFVRIVGNEETFFQNENELLKFYQRPQLGHGKNARPLPFEKFKSGSVYGEIDIVPDGAIIRQF